MADTLGQLKTILRARDEGRARLEELESKTNREDTQSKRLQADLSKQSERLSAMDERVRTLRQALTRESEAARAAITEADAELHALEDRRGSGQVMDAAYEVGARSLRIRRTDAEARIAVREKALEADSAKELDWLDSVPPEHRGADSTQGIDETSISDFPGPSVPARIAMLWRESKRPQSRSSIRTSAIVVGALTLLVVGAVVISSSLNPRDPTDYLREGEFLVPVMVEEAQHIRNLQFTLEYDTEVVAGVSVIQGDVGRLAVMQYDVDRSGRIEVLVRDVTGIDGSGSLVIMRFKTVTVVPEPAPLRFTSLNAIDSRTLLERPVLGDDGWINTEQLDTLAPVLRFP